MTLKVRDEFGSTVSVTVLNEDISTQAVMTKEEFLSFAQDTINEIEEKVAEIHAEQDEDYFFN